MARPRTTSKDAKRTTIYLNPEEDFALSLIENSRRIRKEKRYQPSEIIADTLWFYLERVEGKSREQLTALLPAPPEQKSQANLTQFPKTVRKS